MVPAALKHGVMTLIEGSSTGAGVYERRIRCRTMWRSNTQGRNFRAAPAVLTCPNGEPLLTPRGRSRLQRGRDRRPVIDSLREHCPGVDVLVVDDGSTDQTGQIARHAGARVVRHPFNLGIGGAVQTGFVYALEQGYEYMVQVDGDGQHCAEEIGKLDDARCARIRRSTWSAARAS